MTQFVVMSPGTGPVDGAREREARRNVGALCRELAFELPRVRIERQSGEDDGDGRYGYVLRRGIRKTTVLMPGLPIDRVRLRPNDNPWHFPRLYVDGSSWLWPYAVDSVRDALVDHDGSAERRYKKSEADCKRELSREPRCPVCGTVKERYFTDSRTDNPPHGLERLRCLTCAPIEKVLIKTSDNRGVYADDSWKELQYGCVYRVTERCMPDEATGTEDDPICRRRDWYNRYCRLRYGHEGQCEQRWKEIARERIDLPYRGDGS